MSFMEEISIFVNGFFSMDRLYSDLSPKQLLLHTIILISNFEFISSSHHQSLISSSLFSFLEGARSSSNYIETIYIYRTRKVGNMSSLNPPEDYRIRTLYVGGIYGIITEQDIRDHFSAYSELESVKMVPGRSCAFVTYACRRGAEKAANELAENLQIKGLQLRLSWGRLKTPVNEERRGSIQQQAHVIQPVTASTDPHMTAEGSTSAPEKASEGVAASVSGERVENQITMPSGGGGGKRSSDTLEGMSPQEMRERVIRRKKGSSTSTVPPASTRTPTPVVLPVSAPNVVTPLASEGMAATTQVGSATEETSLTRFITSFPRDFLVQNSGVTTIWPDADSLLFPGPMHLLEKKSDLELVNDATEMTLQAVQSMLMCRRRRLAQLGQQDVWRVRIAEAEAAEARMSSQLREVEAENLSLKEAATAAEARAAAAVEERDARDTRLMTADAQIRELKEKLRLQYEEMREELKYVASSAGLRVRAKLMREFLDGKSSSWNPQAEIDFYIAHIGEASDLVS